MSTISHIQEHCFSSLLEVNFSDGYKSLIAYEILRIYSPNACIKPAGHSFSPLVTNKAFIKIEQLSFKPTQVTITFDDKHDSGNISALYLKKLCQQQDQLWRDYLARLSYAKQLKNETIPLMTS